jgi:thiamine biosynthesis lipoprotein
VTSGPLRLALAAMGTRFELVLVDGRGNLRAAGEAALEEIECWHRRLNRFAADSLLSHINRTAADAPVRIDRETFALFETALEVWRASDGAFDVTVAPLMARHGFEDSSVSARGGRTGADAIELDASRWTIGFHDRRTSLDLGGIAKGHALDRAAAVLRDAGVSCAFLHGGTSSVAAIGRPPNHSGWRVAVGTPIGDRIVTLNDGAMSVSDASSQRSGTTGDGHIMDPRSGRAVGRSGRVTVIGPSATLTEAWSTALIVLQQLPVGFPAGFHCLGLPSDRPQQVSA